MPGPPNLKAKLKAGDRTPLLPGRVLTQVFEKPSLRTRVSFEAAIGQLGGYGIFLTGKEAGLEGRESNIDVARVIGSYSDVIALRTFSQSLIELFAEHSGCHVVNALSDLSHPCQALADILTMQEAFGDVQGRTLAYIGDGNNVAVSLACICAMLGVSFVIAAPAGYQLSESLFDDLRVMRIPTRASHRPPTRTTRSKRPTSSTPTSGPAWARSRRRKPGSRFSRTTRSTRP